MPLTSGAQGAEQGSDDLLHEAPAWAGAALAAGLELGWCCCICC